MKKSLVLALACVFVLALSPATFAGDETPVETEQAVAAPEEAKADASCEATEPMDWTESLFELEAPEAEACWPYECSGAWCWPGVPCRNHCCV